MKDNLKRFYDAQNAPGYGGYDNAVVELTNGKKLSHWIWYVFPQLRSISQNSPYERKYGIENLDEAKDFLMDATLKSRLEGVCNILLNHHGLTAKEIFGMSDAAKVKSSMTLFFLASQDELYRKILDRYFNGLPCQKTLYALNMEMPQRIIEHSHGNSLEIEKTRIQNDFSDTLQTKRHSINISRNRSRSKTRKARKLLILISAVVLLLCSFCGVGYWAYTFAKDDSSKKIIDDEGKYASNDTNNSNQSKFVADKDLSVVLRTSDLNLIGASELEKYLISVVATIGDKACVMDTATNSFQFHYTESNSTLSAHIKASIENCVIGEAKFNYQDLNEGVVDESLKLSVSGADLRIYEELAWYVSAKQQVSESKYPHYLERIKKVADKSFAEFLTNKLKSIGKKSSESVEKKQSREEVYGDDIPDDIRMRVSHLGFIPNSMLSRLDKNQRRIVEEYNYMIRHLKKDGSSHERDECRMELKRCRTFGALRYIVHRFK